MSDCGGGKCAHGHNAKGQETIKFCDTHAKEHSELHERAMVDYRKTNPKWEKQNEA